MSRRVVELAGPAGAGKTTLATALRQQGAATILGLPSSRTAMLAGVLSAGPALLRARMAAPGRWWTAAELRSIGYLHAWQAAAERAGDCISLLDHGPVFRLASLAAGGPPMTSTPAFRRWCTRTAVRWAGRLDAVVWLDAPDDVLLHRIEQRSRQHRLRGAGRSEAGTFLARYRQEYDAVLDVVSRAGTRVIRVDTSTGTPVELADRVRSALDGAVTGRHR